MLLRAFEAFVLGQQPAKEPWKPVTDYSFEARRPIEDPQVELILHAMKPSTVLDAGCGFGHLVMLLRARGVRCYGFDLEKRWPDIIGSKCARVDISNESAHLVERWQQPDLVICREVLEHLTVRQIARTVRNLVRWTSKYVYVTTRFHADPKHLLDVQTRDELDPTHITLLNQDFLRTLFVLEGCRRCEGLEQTMDWRGMGRVLVYEKVA